MKTHLVSKCLSFQFAFALGLPLHYHSEHNEDEAWVKTNYLTFKNERLDASMKKAAIFSALE